MSGKTESIDKSKENTIKCAVEHEKFIVVNPPPTDMKPMRATKATEYFKKFQKCHYGKGLALKIWPQKERCDKCGLSWCTYTKHQVTLDVFIDHLKLLEDRSPE